MHIHRSLLVATLTLGALAAAGSAQAATTAGGPAPQVRAAAVPSPFANGSFETPAVPAGSYRTYASGQSLGAWTVTTGTVDLIGPGYWAAANADQSVDLSGGSMGAVSQTFATTPGTTYTVSYALAGNTDGGPAVKTGTVLVDGRDVQDFSFDITGKTHTDMGYANEQFTFLATTPSATLTFASTTASGYGPVLDNVQVQATCCKQACS